MLSRRSLLLTGAAAAVATFGPSLGATAALGQSLPPLKPLRPGSRLRAVNPGTWLDPGSDLEPLVRSFAAQGWQLEVPASVKRQWRYFSGTDADRLADLKAAWSDPDLDGLVYVGAGWGGARVLESGWRFPQRSLWTLGFSDTSSLLLAQYRAGLPGALHGSTVPSDDAQWARTIDLLSGRPVAPLRGLGCRSGAGVGPLVVTNLTVATHLIGTPHFPDLRGCILVLEDVGEAPYRVDRMLTQWRSAGLLKDLAGVGCGRFSWRGEVEPGDFSMAEILENRLGDLGCPLVLDLPVGHGRPNMALPLGRQARLDGRYGLLTLLN
ncbi:LD-carboxypeptidase [Parasynechococcus sp.]|jgi:muramoyltetrapeptide carboxypeptidase|uniref:S66 peptidase family protein n=1 Tax=Parasynechococcus sp. TaxID=3101203 RepID=UPI003703F1D3